MKHNGIQLQKNKEEKENPPILPAEEQRNLHSTNFKVLYAHEFPKLPSGFLSYNKPTQNHQVKPLTTAFPFPSKLADLTNPFFSVDFCFEVSSMAKGDDAKIKKKNKALRKKLRSDSAKVSSRVAAIIAQKKRRQSGKRRMCQGMCFSLPTLEDPFNDKNVDIDYKKKDYKKKDKTTKTKKVLPSKEVNSLTENGSDASQNKRKANGDPRSNGKNQGQKRARIEKESTKLVKENTDEGCPSKFLISCLKTIQDTMHHTKAFERGKPLFFDPWGFEFWRCYSSGKHVLETGGHATMEQIAWIGSTAVDTITRKEKDGVSVTNPYLLFIVPSQEKATQVRAVCKPLKAFGIHTVSLHPGASIDHQIHGLNTCEPEFLICTPDRLLELVSMKAVDISGACSLIIDGLESSLGDAYLDSIKSIQQRISADAHTVVFCSGLTDAYLDAVSSLLPTPTCRFENEPVVSVIGTEDVNSFDVLYAHEFPKLPSGFLSYNKPTQNHQVKPLTTAFPFPSKLADLTNPFFSVDFCFEVSSMAKGDDAKIKKKNKALRKKLRSDSAKVSSRVAAIIAQKKRRQSGKRRMCQGMCFSLPTLEDPFNDKNVDIDYKKKDYKKKDKTTKTKKVLPSKEVNSLTENGSDASQNKRKANGDPRSNGKNQGQKRARIEKESTKLVKENTDEGCPSKFLISCLKTIQDTMHHTKAFERGKPLFFDPWGFEFWRCYSSGKHVLETGGHATMEQIAWIGSTAVDTITRKEKDGVSVTNPYLLFIVPSQEKATQVRAVCKPLKAFGIHTVSLHPGASIDHQIHGLNTCEPEFLICTPDRLLELVSMKAVDISGACSLIIDGLESSLGDAYLDSIKSIQQRISADAHTVVFCSGLTDAYLDAVSSLLPTPTCRLSID
ncbi:hypothetical protein SSX86_018499 [Deinandra increscens subsp. villosa]|uniref:DEAD/DEAH box helicase domain-containing protein n=1 Tax=Deinandra increscens subsp. villosa TaxID=3103831 RepID=A0AAP0GUU2_9ASTR